ncbi:sporulation integral membrane protein YtvI [Anaerosporobacter faecicola]|uniref:sporulation integral membrane protein YtvI n=1 Tax=Anaerosporobacter faecicola TaxID=2718714 RepID=UPI00143991D2|nr:sporulation integral membrane protein YtvI [Anaerosporobacter faecicola]
MEKTGSKVKTALLIVGTTIAVYLFFRYALFMFVPFILAYFFTKLLRPIVNWIYDKIKMLRMISTTILLLLLVVLLGTVIFFLGKKLVEQISRLVINFPSYQQSILNTFQKMSGFCDKMFGLDHGQAYAFLMERSNTIISNMQDKMVPAITQQSINIVSITVKILAKVGIIFIAVLMMMKDYDSYKETYEKSRFYEDIHKVTGKLSETGIAYIKTQAIIMLITATIMTCGLFLMKNNYALLLGVLISFLDAFPAIGCGLVLIPWAIIELFSKNVVHAAILITIYLICELTRQFLEPKLLGDRIGIKPVFTLMAMLVGVELFGVLGFLLGPLGLVIILAVVKAYES